MCVILSPLLLVASFQLVSASMPVQNPGAGVSIRFVPDGLPPPRPGGVEPVAVVLRMKSSYKETAKKATVTLQVPSGVSVSPPSRSISLLNNADVPVFFNIRYDEVRTHEFEIVASTDDGNEGILKVGERYDFSSFVWKSKLDARNEAEKHRWNSLDFDDSDWSECRLPSMWHDIGTTYLRAKVFVPETWRGKEVCLHIQAADDSDACWLNGVEIGRTVGWDVIRHYEVPSEIIKYGGENLLCIAVTNTYAGGGIYRAPNYFGLSRSEPLAVKPKLHPAGLIGRPLPLRKMRVSNGVLYYHDGGEVALWGANYYPQSWYQYENMKRLGVDMKKAIRDDLDDMKRMGVQLIRIHVFDREISDSKGRIIDNEHLELLDYLIAQGTERGIYFMFTPIAWWGGPNENPQSFSALTPKEYMFCDDTAISAQANYLINWLNHVNRYTGRAYKYEPAICVLEIMNEPAYVNYNMLKDPAASYYRTDAAVLERFKSRLLSKWEAWCSANAIGDDPRFFPLFRYELVSRYLRTMYYAIRSTGAEQPVASSLFDATGHDDIIAAIADSPCEAVTTSLYAGNWEKVGDGTNYLPYATNTSLDSRLDSKARLIYEFDGIKTFGSYFYPACARRFRNLGVQIAAMFQYDSRTTAEWNTDWDAHYLNFLYTPGKAVSFYIGGKVFRDLHRGAEFSTDGTTQRFGNCVVSYDRNVSIYSSDTVYASSAPVGDWRPVSLSKKPTFIVCVGDSPFVEYEGTGIYALNIDYGKRRATLIVNPDAEIVGDPWNPDSKKSAVVLKERVHDFTVKIPGVVLKRINRVGDSGKALPVLKGNTFEVSPGKYLLEW